MPDLPDSENERHAVLHTHAADYLNVALGMPNRALDDGPLADGRVHAMLAGLESFLSSLGEEDFSERIQFDKPLTFDGAMSSPTLVATEALLRCQAGGGVAEAFHDLKEAAEAMARLADLTDRPPPGFSEFAARLIAVKNLFRTAIGDDKEHGVHRGGDLMVDDETVAVCLARFLDPVTKAQDGFLEALVLVAAGYEARHGNTHRLNRFMPAYRRVRDALSHSEPSGQAEGTLIVLEFSRHALNDPKQRREHFKRIATCVLGNSDSNPPRLLWVSLGRFFATRYPAVLESLDLAQHLTQHSEGVPSFLDPLCGGGRVVFRRLEVPEAHAFRRVFLESGSPPRDAWKALALVLAIQPDEDVSVGFVLRALEALNHILPTEFFELQVASERGVPFPMAAKKTIWLPRRTPSELPGWDELLQAWVKGPGDQSNGEGWRSVCRDPRLLVAQAAASILPNRALMFGAAQTVLQSQTHDNARVNWVTVIEKVADIAPHAPIYDYVDLYSRATAGMTAEPPIRSHAKSKRPVILGIDIGGNETKVALYEYDAFRCHITKRIDKLYPTPTTPPPGFSDGKQYASVREFAKIIADKCAAGFDQWPAMQDRIIAIGVTWPGAVAGNPYNEYVAANSLILKYFQPFTAEHWRAKPIELNRLRVREAFEEAFTASSGQPPLVRLSNDGSAHVTASASAFRQSNIGVGEVVAALAVGTGLALKMYDPATGRALPLLSELGRMVTFLGKHPIGGFPGGTARDYLKRDTLGETANEMLRRSSAGITGATAREVPSLLIGWLLEECAGADLASAEREFEQKWTQQNPGTTQSLSTIRHELRVFLTQTRRWRGEHDFAIEVARKVSVVMAGIVSSVSSMFGAQTVFVSGGPMSGATGVYVREFARQELRTGFNYTVVKDLGTQAAPGARHQIARVLRIPEPSKNIDALGPSGAYGAALLAAERLEQTKSHQTRPMSTTPALSSPTLSTYSVLELGPSCRGRLLFPGAEHVPEDCLGYVRSTQRAKLARTCGKLPEALPWRDYPSTVLTETTALVEAPYTDYAVIISARNTLNEWGYQARLNGTWHRRSGDQEVPPEWPVLVLGPLATHIHRMRDSSKDGADLVTGLPLVIDGRPSSRPFMLANSSDVAHLYDLDPQGRRGLSSRVWQQFSDLWQEGKSRNWSEVEFERAMQALVERHEVKESRNLLHSIVAQRSDGSVVLFAITGGLPDIGKELAETWHVQHAILLDQGGSVGWMALNPGDDTPTLMVAGPNHRPRGTTFMVFETGCFLHPAEHLLVSTHVRTT